MIRLREPVKLKCPVCGRLIVRRRIDPYAVTLELPRHTVPYGEGHCRGSKKRVLNRKGGV